MKINFYRPVLTIAALACVAAATAAGAQPIESLTTADRVSPEEELVLYSVDLQPALDNEAPIRMWVNVMADGSKEYRGEWAAEGSAPAQIDFSADFESGEFVATFVEPDLSMVSAASSEKPSQPNLGRDLSGMGQTPAGVFGGRTGYTHTAHVRARSLFGLGSVLASATATLDWCWDSDTGCMLVRGHGGFCTSIHGEWDIDSCTGNFSHPGPFDQGMKTTGVFTEVDPGSPTGPGDIIAQWVEVYANGTNSSVTWSFSSTAISIRGSVLNGGKQLTSC